MRTRMLIAGAVMVVILLMGGGIALERFLAMGRPKAQASACQSNLKQLACGMMMYIQDYDEHLPPGERWTACLDPYIRNTSLHTCPARLDLSWGYAMHRCLPETPARVIAQPALTPMLFDSDLGVPSATSDPAGAAMRHPGGANVAYVDGHVKVTQSFP